MWGSSVGGINDRKVAKAAVRKPTRPRSREVNEVKEVKNVRDSEAESGWELDRAIAGEAEMVGS